MKHIRHPFCQEGGAALSGSCRMSFAEGTSQAMSLTFRAERQASTELKGFRGNPGEMLLFKRTWTYPGH